MERQIVKLCDDLTGDCLIIITDAPADVIKKWITDHNNAEMIGMRTSIYKLGDGKYYVKVLHDSETDPVEDKDLYQAHAYYHLHRNRKWELRKKDVLDMIAAALKEKNQRIDGRTDDKILLHNECEGPRFSIRVTGE